MKKALIQLHIAVFLWGFTGVLGRLISLNEGLLVWWRMFFTVVTLVALRFFFKEFERISFKDALRIGGVGALVAIHWVAFYGSIKMANVSIALTCMAAGGIFTALAEPFAFKRKIDVREVLLGIMALVGIGLIFHFNPKYKWGIIIGIFSVLLAVIFSILNKMLVGKFSAKTISMYELGGGWLAWTLLLPVYLYFIPSESFWPQGMDWVWLLVMAWFCTVLSVNLSLQALKHISAFTQNLTLNLEPVYGIVLAFIIFKENKDLSPGFYWGFLLIALAVVLQMIRVSKK
ncbi:MAG: DMT family transporter [Chitinophagaceae bacterium]|nr:DMT family transporter [Chitinophagaceae bacterium]